MLLRKLKNWLVGNVLVASVPEDVLEVKMGTMYLGGRKVSDDEATQLTQEAYFIRHSKLWAVMQSTLRKDAETRMFNKALSFDDMWAGKMMMYNLSVQNKILLVPKQNNSSETSVTV